MAGVDEAGQLSRDVVRAIDDSPGRDYRWPGNFRELEQCVRSVMLRGEYRPAALMRWTAERCARMWIKRY